MKQIEKHSLNKFPEMSKEHFNNLKNDIIVNGYDKTFPVYLYEDKIIDGWNRYKACKELNIEPNFKEFKGDKKEAVVFILRTNNRRDLTPYQRSIIALEYAPYFEEKAKERMLSGNPSQTFDKGRADEKIGDVAQVSHETIRKVKKIQEKATEEIKAKLRTGEVSINAAYKEIKKEEKKEERINIIKEQIEDIESGKVPELKGLYNVISIDPAWNYEGENKNITSYDANGRRVANPYPEMSTQEIKDIKLPLMNDSVVFLWTTHKFLPDAFDILKNWNLDYKATLVWNKEKIGMGAWFRMQCEFCLVGIKGKPYWDNTTYRDIINEPRRQHSRKPDAFFDMVDKITLGRKLEYFSREKREGWDVFGNDVNKY